MCTGLLGGWLRSSRWLEKPRAAGGPPLAEVRVGVHVGVVSPVAEEHASRPLSIPAGDASSGSTPRVEKEVEGGWHSAPLAAGGLAELAPQPIAESAAPATPTLHSAGAVST